LQGALAIGLLARCDRVPFLLWANNNAIRRLADWQAVHPTSEGAAAVGGLFLSVAVALRCVAAGQQWQKLGCGGN
jgi:hypothetical protein